MGIGYGMPTISRGRLFQFARFGKQARLECQKSETGEPLWKFEYDDRLRRSVRLRQRAALLAGGRRRSRVHLRAEGMLHCLRVIDGNLLWKVDTKEKFGVVQNFFGVGSTPVIFGDLLICQVGGSDEDSRDVPPGQLDRVRGKDSGVVAFDKRTGAVKYQISDELASYAGPALATIGGRPWCFAFARGGLLAFDPASGQIDFHFPWRAPILESVNASNPVIVGDRVFISETYGPGSALLRVAAGQVRGSVERQGSSPRQAVADALEHAGSSRRLCLRLERAPFGRRRAAVLGTRDRQDHVESARPEPIEPVVRGRPFRSIDAKGATCC